MKLFKKRLTEPVQDIIEPGSQYPVYDYAAEEEFVKAGDFNGYIMHVFDRSIDLFDLPLDIAMIARQVARIEIEKARQEGMF